MPYPAASAALIDGLAEVGGLQLDSQDLHESARRTRLRIDELITNSDEHRQMVAQLEAQADQEQAALAGLAEGIPSGDEIAAELERFLRGERGS
jgi:predicted ATP-grasp superfamily ATP-dependent carboligase